MLDKPGRDRQVRVAVGVEVGDRGLDGLGGDSPHEWSRLGPVADGLWVNASPQPKAHQEASEGRLAVLVVAVKQRPSERPAAREEEIAVAQKHLRWHVLRVKKDASGVS